MTNLLFLRVGSVTASCDTEDVTVPLVLLLKRLILFSAVATGVLALLSVSFSLVPSLLRPCVLAAAFPFLFF